MNDRDDRLFRALMGDALQPGEFVMISNQSPFYGLRCVVNAVHNDLVHVTPLPLQIVGLSHQFEKTPPIKTYEESVNEDYDNMVRLLNPLNSTYRLGDIVSVDADGAIVVATIINIDSDVMFQAIDFQNNIIQLDYRSIIENLKDDGSCVDMYGNRIFLDDVITIKEGIYNGIQATVCHTYQHFLLCLTFGDERQYYACQDTNTMLGESPKCQIDFSDIDLDLILTNSECTDLTGKPVSKCTNVKPTQYNEDCSSIAGDQPFPDDSEIQWADPLRSTNMSALSHITNVKDVCIPPSPKTVTRPSVPSIPGFPNTFASSRQNDINQSLAPSPQVQSIYQQSLSIPNQLPPPPQQPLNQIASPRQKPVIRPPSWLIEDTLVRIRGSDKDAVVTKVYPNFCVVQNIQSPGQLEYKHIKVSFDNVEKYDISVGQKVIVIKTHKSKSRITGKVTEIVGSSVRILVDSKNRQEETLKNINEIARNYNWEEGDEDDEI